MHRRIVLALACLAVGLAAPGPAATPASAAASRLDPTIQVDPRRIVVELASETPRPRRALERAAPGAAVGAQMTGVPALDAVGAALGVTAWEPGFPEATWPAWRRAGLASAPAAADTAREDLSRFLVVTLPLGASLEDALTAYANTAGVAGAEPVPQLPVSFVPSDSLFSDQYALQDPEDHDSDGPEAWDVFRGDTTIVVAIVDTGVEYTHPDLGGPPPSTGRVLWTNYTELGGLAGIDDDGNGYVDDVHGWDFVTGQTGAPGEDTTVPDNDPSDFAGHGTLVTGCATARTDNVSGIAGTGFRSRFMPLRVGWSTQANPNGLIDEAFCASAIVYAAHNGAIAVNCSWSNAPTAMLAAAANEAIALGVTIVVAAGNQNTGTPPLNYLASRGDCVDVGATESNDLRAPFSNYGAWVDISAAGVGVLSTAGASHIASYGTGTGTSFAAPIVTGAVALAQGHRKSLGLPLLTPAEMILRLRDTGDNIDALNGVYAGLMGTRLNLHRLLADPPTSWVSSVSASSNAVATADLNQDGVDEIVVGGANGSIVALRPGEGDPLPGWPVNLGAGVHSSAAIWDLDDDHVPNVIVGTDNGKVWALDGNGLSVPGWPVQLSGIIFGGPAIGEVDPAAGLECVVATGDSAVYVIDRNGSVRPGFPVKLRGAIIGTPALHDFDGDGFAEIVAAGYDSSVAVWNHAAQLLPGWPKKLGHVTMSAPAVGDIDGDGHGDIVLGANDGKVYAFDEEGVALAGWPVTVPGPVRSSPALADLVDGDGVLEVAIACDAPAITVLRGDGSTAPGWPRFMVGLPSASLAVGDVDDDGTLDVVSGARDGNIHIIRAGGQNKVGWPKKFDGPVSAPPTLADPDRDGRLELLFVTENGRLRNVDFGPGTFDATRLPWPTMHRDFLRRGSTSPALVGVPPGGPGAGGAASGVALAVRATPNPARGATTIELVRGSTAAAGSASVAPPQLRLYNVTGRLVRELSSVEPSGDVARVVWDGRDAAGRFVPPGLYFARGAWKGVEGTTRLVLLP